MNQPLVSVVMPVCNVERFLAESIESILGQTFRDFEFIIIDFGSTDNSTSIVSSYAARDNRIKFHKIPNCVLPAARNAGCSLAQGKYIAIMDADDVSLTNRLALQVDFIERRSEIALLGGATEWIDATGRSLGAHHVPSEYYEIQSALATRCPFWHPTILIRKDIFLIVGGYRAAFIFAHDYDLELRIAERFECTNLKQVVLKYRIHPFQVTFHSQRQQTLYKLAAQASAIRRGHSKLDPLEGARKITTRLLAELGVGEPAQQNALASDCRNWIRSMSAAREYSAALDAARQMLGSRLNYVERWQIADLRLAVARLYWKQGRFVRSAVTAGHALITRPLILARPLKLFLRWFRF